MGKNCETQFIKANGRLIKLIKILTLEIIKMDALIAQIVEKTGVSEEVAKTIVDMVLENVKGQLPANMQGMVDSLLGGGGGDAGGLGNLLGGFLKK
jgi:hypothetical protein